MKMMWTVVGMLAGISVLTAPVAHASLCGSNENHHWLSPLVRLAINLISLTALLGLVLAPDVKADAEDYIVKPQMSRLTSSYPSPMAGSTKSSPWCWLLSSISAPGTNQLTNVAAWVGQRLPTD
jgi:hypothetical protein